MPIRQLPPALAEKAKKELNEDPARQLSDVQHLKDWLAKQPHIIARTDDQWLVAFLRGCKYSLERTKEKIDLYYSIRHTAPEFFNIPYNGTKFQEILSKGVFVQLPKTAGPDSPRVTLIRPGYYDADKYTITEVMAVASVVQKVNLMEDDHCTVAGVVTILDLDGVNMSHFLQMTPMNMKKMTVASQEAIPIRMKGVHYLHTPAGFETIFNTAKSFLNEKNKNRLYVHNKNYEGLYKHVPKEILPKEYGGDGGAIADIIDYWKKKLEEYSSFLEEDMKYRTDESKRPGKPRTAESMFGLEGSFRQLAFD